VSSVTSCDDDGDTRIPLSIIGLVIISRWTVKRVAVRMCAGLVTLTMSQLHTHVEFHTRVVSNIECPYLGPLTRKIEHNQTTSKSDECTYKTRSHHFQPVDVFFVDNSCLSCLEVSHGVMSNSKVPLWGSSISWMLTGLCKGTGRKK